MLTVKILSTNSGDSGVLLTDYTLSTDKGPMLPGISAMKFTIAGKAEWPESFTLGNAPGGKNADAVATFSGITATSPIVDFALTNSPEKSLPDVSGSGQAESGSIMFQFADSSGKATDWANATQLIVV